MFSFEPTTEIDISEYEYELYADSAGLNLISTGKASASVFTIDVPDNSGSTTDSSTQSDIVYYGRIRAIDTSGNAGVWTPSSGLKTSTATQLIEGTHIRSLTAAKITAGTINAHEIILKQQGTQTVIAAPANMAIIRSSNYNGSYSANATPNWTQGTSGWVIAGNGYAEFDSAVIRGTIKAGAVWIDANNRWNTNANNTALVSEFKVGSSTNFLLFNASTNTLTLTGNLTAATGTISGATLSGGTISGGSISIGGGTFQVNSSGGLTASSATISGTINASSGTFSGTINATGTISGGTISGASISGGVITGALITTDGFSVDSVGSIITRNCEVRNGFSYRAQFEFPGSANDLPGLMAQSSGGGERIVKFTSKREFKENIEDMPEALPIINSLRPRVFNSKLGDIDPSTDEPWTEQAKEIYSLSHKNYGFIADEVYKDFSHLACLAPSDITIPFDQKGGYFDIDAWEPQSWKHLELIAILTKAVQELSARVEQLESQLES